MKNILILTSEYSSDSKPNERWPKVVSYFAKEWAKDNKVIVVINSSRFPKLFYYFGFLLRTIVAWTYHKDPKYITDQEWSCNFSFNDGRVNVYNRPLLKIYPHAKYTKKQLDRQVEYIIDIMKENNFTPDIIDGHWMYPQLDLILKLKEQFKAKTALIMHGSVTREWRFKKEDGHKLNQLDRIGCRNKPLTYFLYKELQLKEIPFVCASGLPDQFATKAPSDKKPLAGRIIKIVSTCRLLDWKCIDEAVKGIENAFHGENYLYEIIGEGPQYHHIHSVITSLGIENKVSLVGRLPRAEVQNKLKSADIFVLISKHETFGLVYLEAMIQGCITIGSRQGGIDGIIVDGENGFLCEEGNAEDLANVLIKIKGLTFEEKNEISKNAINTALYYTDSKVAQRYLDNIS